MNTINTGSKHQIDGDNFEVYDPRKPLFKYTTVDTAKIILKNKTLRFSVASAFNDPFELHEDYIDFSLKGYSLVMHILRLSLFSSKPRLEVFRDARNENIHEGVIDSYKNSINETKKNTLIFCTSKSYNKSLMWSHYADKHTGVCIGLILPPFMEWANGTVRQISLPVRYTEKIIAENYFNTHQAGQVNVFHKWLCSKSEDWSYEEEVRSIVLDYECKVKKVDGKFYDMPIPVSMIKELYFGLRCSQNDIQDINKILLDEGYQLDVKAKMEMEKGMYRLKVVPIS